MIDYKTKCPICEKFVLFTSEDDFWSCRENLQAETCSLGGCVTRERALAYTLFTLFSRKDLRLLDIHEAAAATRGLSLWLEQSVPGYVRSGYFPDQKFGEVVNGFRNENLELQTFQDAAFDIVLHLDVMEHLFNPFQALKEIYRTLKSTGICLFTAPTEHTRFSSEQVAWIQEDGELKIVGEPEYHGNPQRPEDGALVTWRYGYDLPVQISRHTDFDVEVRRWQSQRYAIMGYMTEVYILRKRS